MALPGDIVPDMDTALGSDQALSGTQWTLVRDDHKAVIVEVGGGLRTYQTARGEVVDGYDGSEVCPASAGQMLAPWPNRIRDGRFTFDGQTHQLPLTEPAFHNSIHGLVCWSRWRAVEVACDKVVLEHDLVPQPGYPWPLLMRTTWSLGKDGLRADHEAINVGSRPCPFGFAPHPYLAFDGVAVDDLLLRVPARSRLLADSRCLPIGAARAVGGEYDFIAARPIGGAVLDVTFGDIEMEPDGTSSVTVAAPDGRATSVWADAGFTWWQVYTGDTQPQPRYRRSVAVEPMTCPPDAFRSGKDVVVLQPGETWRGSWGIRPYTTTG
jgi:aldose 1-epimerase